ncbi:MAG: ferrochelatase, partial [Bacteroidetes bacterium HGW-Bacteroidetes-23]
VEEENGGEEFLAIPCLNDDDDWCKTLSRWIDQWAFAQTETAK